MKKSGWNKSMINEMIKIESKTNFTQDISESHLNIISSYLLV